MPSKPRHLLSGRDMAYSIIPLVLICLVLAGASRACAFSPGGPQAAPPPTTIDAAATLSSQATTAGFPLRLPRLPEGWVANSSSRTTVRGATGGTSVGVGWISPDGRYLRLVQSSAATDPLLAAEVQGRRSPTSAEDLTGTSWTIYTQQGAEPAWVADLGPVRLLITGSGTEEDFRTLAIGTTSAEPLPG
ncbi:DUF4245 domain-containing protein [Rhodococcus aerolatus]